MTRPPSAEARIRAGRAPTSRSRRTLGVDRSPAPARPAPSPSAHTRRQPDAGPHKPARSEEHTSELQSHLNLVCRLLLEKKKHTYAFNAIKITIDRASCYSYFMALFF